MGTAREILQQSGLALVWKDNPRQVGNGIYAMHVCFPNIGKGVHVPFSFEAHSENEYLQTIGQPHPCDGSCTRRDILIQNFEIEGTDSCHARKPIIEMAKQYEP